MRFDSSSTVRRAASSSALARHTSGNGSPENGKTKDDSAARPSERSCCMANKSKTAIVTGASQGIGAGLVTAFLERGYAVVANARNMTQSSAFKPSEKLALVEGDIAKSATASTIAETAIAKFGSIDALVNNAGIFLAKPFTSYTVEDFRLLSSTNLAR